MLACEILSASYMSLVIPWKIRLLHLFWQIVVFNFLGSSCLRRLNLFSVTHVIRLPFLLSKNNIQQVFQKFHVLLKEEFSPEDVQIIACPSMEQVGNLCYFYNLLVILLQ